MIPKVIIAPIVGNMCAIAWFSFTGAGLTSAASPVSVMPPTLSTSMPGYMVSAAVLWPVSVSSTLVVPVSTSAV